MNRAPLWALPLLLACADAEPVLRSPDSGGPGGDDTGAAVEDCRILEDAEDLVGELQFKIDPLITTLVTISWKAKEVDGGWVWYSRAGEARRSVPAELADEELFSATLLGLKADTEYQFQIVHRVEGELVCTAPAAVTTGLLPAGLPRLEVEAPEGAEAMEGFALVPLSDVVGGGGSWATIVDADGDFVWYLRADALRLRLSLDGEALVHSDRSFDLGSESLISRTPLDGSPPSFITVSGGHSDFVEVEPGTYATFDWELREFDGGARRIAGERLVEIDPEGRVTVIWSVFDDFSPDLDQVYEKGLASDPEAEIWPHFNHLHYEADEDAYYVVARTTVSVHRVDRATGKLSWTLEGRGGGDFEPAGEQPVRFVPHSAMPTEKGLLLFDTDNDASGGCSTASEYTMDLDAGTADPTWFYATEDCLRSDFLGNAEELWNGNRTLVLAMAGQMDEVSSTGALRWRMRAPYGWWLLYASRIPTLTP